MTLLLLAIGLAAGILSGLIGIGGGVLIVPALMFFARFPAKLATGTSLGALLLPVGLLGAWEYHKAGNIDIKASLLLAGGIFVGAFLGAQIVQHLSELQLRRIFAGFLVLVAVQLWLQ